MHTDKNFRLTQIIILSFVLCLLSSLCGCEAFRKKFVRKPKKEKEIEVVIETQEYKAQYSREQTYKKYFIFWKSAYEELIDLLNVQKGSRKKRVSLARRIIENLRQMRQFLLPEKQKSLDDYILVQENIARELDEYRLSRIQILRIKSTLKKQKRQIQKEFALKYIQEYLIK